MVSTKLPYQKRKRVKKKASSANLSPGLPGKTSAQDSPEVGWVLPEDSERPARRWLWVGVGSFIVMIIVLWGWSVKLRFQSVSWQASQEYALGKNTKAAWNQIFTEQKKSIVNQQLEKTEIKNIIKQLLANQAASTTAPATTTN